MATQHQQCLYRTRTQVQSQAQCSGLKDPGLPQLRGGGNCSMDPTPGLGTPYAMGGHKKKKKERKTEKTAGQCFNSKIWKKEGKATP